MVTEGTLQVETNDWKTGAIQALDMSSTEILMLSALLCSTDVIAAISMVNYKE